VFWGRKILGFIHIVRGKVRRGKVTETSLEGEGETNKVFANDQKGGIGGEGGMKMRRAVPMSW